MNSFGDDLVVKMRKPYTITKQREKWTEEEHNRFLEALKLYGRAWQRIEEHIGTKTAIQIRSHAQKFFTKLEKEAVAAGSTSEQAHDIAIPPPRPKKKPNYPYPRKTVFCSIPPASSETTDAKALKAMNNPSPQAIINKQQEASVAAKLLQETKECSDEGHSSLVLNLFQDAPSASILSRDNKGYTNRLVGFGEYAPMSAQPKEQPSLTVGSSLTIEVNLDSTLNGVMKSNQALGSTSGITLKLHASSESDYKGPNAEAMQPTCCIDGSNKLKATVENEGPPSNSSALTNQAKIPVDPAFHDCSAMSSIPPFPTFPTFSQLRTTQDLYRSSFLGISPTFSSQIVSTLMQNPAIHAAACMAAASLYPSEEMDSPCTTAIAAATIAAASAWWGTNGLIPFFPPPIHASGFAFSTDQAAAQEQVEGMHATNFSNFIPSSDVLNPNNSDRAKIVKHERSSCGSNTSSSSEMETDAAMLNKKNGETKNNKDIIKQSSNFQQNLPAGEANNTRRGRAISSLCLNETWKEVSQEGRLAFQALFTRDILPQSFATQFVKPAMGWPNEEGVPASGWEEGPTQNCSVSNEIKLGNLKVVRPTGFKPYKRCSAEVEVGTNSANDESSKYKKIRVQ